MKQRTTLSRLRVPGKYWCGQCPECESDQLQAACWINEEFLSHTVPRSHRSRYRRDRGQDWAGGGKLLRLRRGLHHGGQHLRRLCVVKVFGILPTKCRRQI